MAPSLKIVTGGGRGYEGAFANFWNGQGQGVLTPAGTARTLTVDLHIPAGDTWRAAVNCFDASHQLIRATPLIVTGTGAWQTVSFDIPALSVDCSQQLSETGGSAGASLGSIAVNVRNVVLVDKAAAPTKPVPVSSTFFKDTLTTWSKGPFTVPAGLTDSVLQIYQAYNSKDRPIVGTPTWNGHPMTPVVKGAPTVGGNIEAWEIRNPPAGTGTINFAHSSTVAGVLGVFLYQNVDQTATTRNIQPAYSTSSLHPQATVASDPDDVVIAAVVYGAVSTTVLSPDAGQTDAYNQRQFTTFGIVGAGTTKPGAASVTVGWTVTGTSGSNSTLIAVSLKGATVTVPAAPVNTALPAITGSAVQGGTLSGSDGEWNNAPTSISYQYKRETTAGSGVYVALDGATHPIYDLGPEDVGLRFKLTVTAENAGGATSATSDPIGPVASITPVVVADQGPVASGDARVGGEITVDPGFWLNGPTSFGYQLRKDDGRRGAMSDVAGATSPTYTVQPGDENCIFEWTVVASNASGSGSATSSTIGPIGPTVAVLDDANRPNENPLALPWAGPTRFGGGQLQLSGNRFKTAAGVGISAQAYRTDVSLADVSVAARVPDLPSAHGAAVWARIQNPGNQTLARGYSFDYLLGQGFAIFRMTAGGTFAQLGSYNTSHVLAAGEQLRFDVSGTSLTGYWIDTAGVAHQAVAVTDGVITGPGAVGIEMNDLAVSLDDFNAAQLVAPTDLVGILLSGVWVQKPKKRRLAGAWA